MGALGQWLKAVSETLSLESQDQYLALLDRAIRSAESLPSRNTDDVVFDAINHPLGYCTEALFSWWYRTGPKAGDGIIAPVRGVMERLIGSRMPAARHARVILTSRLFSLFLADADWTAQHLIPRLSWGGGSQEDVSAAWRGYLWQPRISGELLKAFEAEFFGVVQHFESLGDHGAVYAQLLALVALEFRDATKDVSIRRALAELPTEGLAEAAGMLATRMQEVQQQSDSYWQNRVRPAIEKLWPKDSAKRSPTESEQLALVCIRSGGMFADAVGVLGRFLLPVIELYRPVTELERRAIGPAEVEAAVQLLRAVTEVRAPTRPPPDEYRTVLERLRNLKPDLSQDVRFRALSEFVARTTGRGV